MSEPSHSEIAKVPAGLSFKQAMRLRAKARGAPHTAAFPFADLIQARPTRVRPAPAAFARTSAGIHPGLWPLPSAKGMMEAILRSQIRRGAKTPVGLTPKAGRREF